MSLQTCKHCNETIPASLRGEDFCCAGCAIAYDIINQNDASLFYDLRQRSNATAQQKTQIKDSTGFDAYLSQAFNQHYVFTINENLQRVEWYVEGIHCAACVWLLERAQKFDPGILRSRIHFSNKQLITDFDPQLTNPQKIAQHLAAIGYILHPWQSDSHKQHALKEQRNLYTRCAIACASMLGCMHVSWNILAGEFTLDLDAHSQSFFSYLAAALAIPAITYCAWPWYRSAFNKLRQKDINIDVSISIIIILGSVISFYHLALGRSDLYFDAMSMFVCFLLIGKLILHVAYQRVEQKHDLLQQLLPLFIDRKTETGLQCINIQDIVIGDELQIKHGQRFPCDGTLLDHEAQCDNALLNGEQAVIHYKRGAQIHAGARNVGTDVGIQCTCLAQDSQIARICAQHYKQRTDDNALTDRLLFWFTPLVSLCTLITWLAWQSIDPAQAWNQAIAVFIVACPCAIGIAAPLAQAMLCKHAANEGILIQNAHALDVLARSPHIVFDKTGTLSNGSLRLKHLNILDQSTFESCKTFIADACKQSQHPIAKALLTSLNDATEAVNNAPIRYIDQGISINTPFGDLFIKKSNSHNNEQLTGFNHTDFVLNNNIIAQCSFSDEARHELMPFILQHLDHISIASGDHQDSVELFAQTFSIDAKQCHGDLNPEQKAHYISTLQQNKPVVMIGDGANDVLALQTAKLSIGVRGGLEAALKCSDIYISEHIEQRLPRLWSLAHAYRSCVHNCLALSLVYNIIGIACAALGMWGPFICAIAMPLSSLSVIAIAMQWPFNKTHKIIQNESTRIINHAKTAKTNV